MDKTRLGTTDVMVSPVCLGCMGFGEPEHGQHEWTLDYAQTKPILQRALEAGINFFDTAPVYSDGDSEAFIGRALKELGVQRKDVVLATKFYPKPVESEQTTLAYIESCLDASLARLQTDYVDLYILHMWDYNTPIEETLEALDSLVKAKKIRHIGISNAYAWQVAMANTMAKERGLTPFVSIQGHYNLIFREEEREMIPCVNFFGMAITPYSSLAGGRLARKKTLDTKRKELDSYARFKYDKTEAEDRKIIDEVEKIAGELGVSMASVSLAWLMAKGAVPIAGATKPEQIEAMKAAMCLQLNEAQMECLDANYIPHALVGVMAQNKPGSSPFSRKDADLKHLEKQ